MLLMFRQRFRNCYHKLTLKNQSVCRYRFTSPIQFTLNIDDSIEPAVIDLSFLNELGADKVKEYTGVEIAHELTNQINRIWDQRFFEFLL